MEKNLTLAAFLAIVLTPAGPAVAQSVSSGPSEDELRQALTEAQNADVQASKVGKIPAILGILVSTTKFEGHVNLNGKVNESALNVYVLAPHLREHESTPEVFFRANVFGNCAYVGFNNAIICDSDFLSGFLMQHGVDGNWLDMSSRGSRWTFEDGFLAWIFGHELGHVVEGSGAAHYGPGDALDRAADATIELSQKREMKADVFAAKRIATDKKLSTTVEQLLIELINQEIEKKNGKSPAYGVGLNWDYTDEAVIAYFTNKDHPEYVVRATRILTVLAADGHEEGLQALLESFTRHLVPRKEQER